MKLIANRAGRFEQRLWEQARVFNGAVSLAMTPSTIHPDYDYRFAWRGGFCGVVNFSFGIRLVHLGIIQPNELGFARGRIVSPSGEVLDENHRRLNAFKFARKWQLDFTSDQYPRGRPIVLQSFPGNVSEELLFDESESIPFTEYDVAKFGGRLALFYAGCHSAAKFLGYTEQRRNGWWPIDSLIAA
jgi:hypothetical protein